MFLTVPPTAVKRLIRHSHLSELDTSLLYRKNSIVPSDKYVFKGGVTPSHHYVSSKGIHR